MLKKKFLKTKCKVEFSIPDSIADDIVKVNLVGDFNNWDQYATPMEKRGNVYTVTLDLELRREHQFRYLVNGVTWHNDPEADHYVANPYNGENSVVTTYPPK